jgi:hypothetical protein
MGYKMKIIKVDNFNRESISDVLIATSVSEYYADIIVRMLNKILGGTHAIAFYRAVEDDYKLYEFIP